MTARETGALGERLAAQAYRDEGYMPLCQNYRTRFGEVDLILRKDGAYVFCEVKTRGPGALARPAEWVDTNKQRRVLLAAQAYVQEQGLGEPVMRFDVAEVDMDGRGTAGAKVRLIPNAFGA